MPKTNSERQKLEPHEKAGIIGAIIWIILPLIIMEFLQYQQYPDKTFNLFELTSRVFSTYLFGLILNGLLGYLFVSSFVYIIIQRSIKKDNVIIIFSFLCVTSIFFSIFDKSGHEFRSFLYGPLSTLVVGWSYITYAIGLLNNKIYRILASIGMAMLPPIWIYLDLKRKNWKWSLIVKILIALIIMVVMLIGIKACSEIQGF